MGTASIATLSKFAIDDTSPAGATIAITDFDASSKQGEFLTESMKMQQEHYWNEGMRGSRSRFKQKVRIARESVGGQITLNPTFVELDQWLPRILGAAEVANSFALAATVPEFHLLFDRIAKRFMYQACKINKATFSASSGQPVTLTLDILGKDEVESATAFPVAVPALDSGNIMMASDVTFSLAADASAAQVFDWSITIDNMLMPDRFANSTSRISMPETDRVITLQMNVPYTADEIDLYNQAIAGAAGSLTITGPGGVTVFTFANIKVPADAPTAQRRGAEIVLPIAATIYASAASEDELVVTNT